MPHEGRASLDIGGQARRRRTAKTAVGFRAPRPAARCRGEVDSGSAVLRAEGCTRWRRLGSDRWVQACGCRGAARGRVPSRDYRGWSVSVEASEEGVVQQAGT
jgi:hypothetical protein